MLQMEVYQKIMDDIIARTGGEYELMSYSDKLMTISIMKEIKAEMDRYMREQYPIVKAWSSLDPRDIQLESTEPDLTRFKSEESYFNRLIGGRL